MTGFYLNVDYSVEVRAPRGEEALLGHTTIAVNFRRKGFAMSRYLGIFLVCKVSGF